MVDDDMINEIEEEVQKDILDQKDTIDPLVEEHLNQMGFLWERVHEKLKEDNTCFKCKKEIIKDEAKQVFILEGNSPKGSILFVSMCKTCNEKLQKENKTKEE